jgi:hypothetical protein
MCHGLLHFAQHFSHAIPVRRQLPIRQHLPPAIWVEKDARGRKSGDIYIYICICIYIEYVSQMFMFTWGQILMNPQFLKACIYRWKLVMVKWSCFWVVGEHVWKQKHPCIKAALYPVPHHNQNKEFWDVGPLNLASLVSTRTHIIHYVIIYTHHLGVSKTRL